MVATVSSAPLTHPIRLFPLRPAKVICSEPIFIIPKDGNPEAEATVIVVSIADNVSLSVVALAEKVRSPAEVVTLIGVISLYAPP